MGRFFQTDKPEFIQDFIYQPPWELAAKVLGEKQQDFDLGIAQATIIGDVKYDHINSPVALQRAKAISEQFGKESNSIIERMRAATMEELPALNVELGKLKRSLETNMNTGQIFKEEQSLAEQKKHEEYLKTIKDKRVSGYSRAKAMSEYEVDNGNYKGDSAVDSDDISGEFIKNYLPQVDANMYTGARKTTNGEYFYGNKNVTKERQNIEKRYQEFVQQDKYRAGLQYLDKAGISNIYEADGQTLIPLSDRRSSLYFEGEMMKGFNYREQTNEQDMSNDGSYAINAKAYADKRTADKLKNIDESDNSAYSKYSLKGQEVTALYVKEETALATQSLKLAGVKPNSIKGYSIDQIDQRVKAMDRDMGNGAQDALTNRYRKLYNDHNRDLKTGVRYLSENLDQATITAVENKHKTKEAQAEFMSKPVFLTGSYVTKQGKVMDTFTGKTDVIDPITKKVTKGKQDYTLTPAGLKGKVIPGGPNGELITVTGVKLVDQSMNAYFGAGLTTNVNGKKELNVGTTAMLEITGVDANSKVYTVTMKGTTDQEPVSAYIKQ